jgi:hypothetical protein
VNSPITPIIESLLFLFLISFLKIRIPIKTGTVKPEAYDEIILFGSVWGDLIVSPLRSALHLCLKAGKKVHLAITCETTEADKNGLYGYEHVFGSGLKRLFRPLWDENCLL